MSRLRHPALLAAVLALLTAPAGAQTVGTAGAFLRWPDIHGDQVVFSSEGDLWLASLSRGIAQRLTSHPGTETRPHFSPDGTQIAFTGQYDSDADVYVMPTTGGAPVRLTYDPTGAQAAGWAPDGKSVLFTSRRDSLRELSRLFTVPAAGGAPHVLPIPEVQQAAMNADGSRVAYVPISADWQYWYRYKGGMADHLWLTDTQAKTFRRLSDFDGIDKDPVWVGETLYFISQRDGVPNLYRMNPVDGKAMEVTHYKLTDYPDASAPNAAARSVSFTDYEIDHLATDGKRLIFEHGNGLGLYDPAAGTTRELRFTLASDRIHARPHPIALAPAVEEASLGPTGRRLVVTARGQLVSVAVKEGDARLIAPLPGSRSHSPVWSPDGKRVAFLSDRSGEEEVWIAPAQADADSQPRQLTRDHKGPLGRLEWSPDGRWLVVGDREMRILLVDAESGATTVVDQADRGGTYDSGNDDYHFSPDGKWLTYGRTEPNWNESIYLYDIARKQKTRVTEEEMNAWSPAFDTAGKYLVYLADREFRPRGSGASHYFAFDRTARVCLVALSKETKSPYLLTNDEEGMPDEDAAKRSAGDAAASPSAAAKPTKSTEAKKGKAPTKPTLPAVKIDLDGLPDRQVNVPLAAGRYQRVALQGDRLLVQDGENPFAADADNPGGTLLTYSIKKPDPADPESAKAKVLAERISDFALTPDGKRLLIRSGQRLTVVGADADAAAVAKAGAVPLNGLTITVAPEAEWRQIFNESWRIARDFFYDPNLHGVDWAAVHAKYARLLPVVASRGDMNLLLGDMIAELNTGHAYVGGGDYGGPDTPAHVPMGFLGAELSPGADGSAAYQVGTIYAGDGFDLSVRSPLLEPGVNIRPGDYILDVAGQPVRADQDIQALLAGTAGQIITLTVNSRPDRHGARHVQVRPISAGAQGRLLYYAWVASRRDYVRQHGGANLAYVHIPDMSGDGLTEFAKHYYPSLDKDGIVYDVRYNGGGYIDAMLLLQMASKPYSYFQPRYGASWTRQDWAFPGHSVALCNEYSCSDAEEFSDAFQRLKIGPLIGARSWGGEVGSGGGYRLIDGGVLNIPNYGEWTPDGHWVIEGTGAQPDIPVEQDPAAVLAGRDPQLDRAIAYLKEAIANAPVARPAHPPFPNKAYVAAPTAPDSPLPSSTAAARRKAPGAGALRARP